MRTILIATAMLGMAGTALAQTTVTTTQERSSTEQAGGVLAGAGVGAAAGAIVGGPFGAVVGGFIGTAVGATAAVTPEVREYVVANPVAPVAFESELAEGVIIPETVELTPIPDNDELAYIYLEGNRPVIVNASTRAVVYSPAGVPQTAVTYVDANPVEEVTLEGEIVAGEVVPSTVTLTPLPEQSGYSYFYANGRPYIVADSSREVIYVRQ